MNVSEVMTARVHTSRGDAPVTDIVRTMITHRISAVPVVADDGRLLGLVTVKCLLPESRVLPFSNLSMLSLADDYIDEESLPQAYAEIATRRAEEVMQEAVLTATPEMTLTEAARLMAERSVTALPVVSDGVVVGMVTRSDVARLVLKCSTD